MLKLIGALCPVSFVSQVPLKPPHHITCHFGMFTNLYHSLVWRVLRTAANSEAAAKYSMDETALTEGWIQPFSYQCTAKTQTKVFFPILLCVGTQP